MRRVSFYLIIVIIVAALGVGGYFGFFKPLQTSVEETSDQALVQEEVAKQIVIRLTATEDGLLVEWEGLPENAGEIIIYRRGEDGEWIEWQSLITGERTTGAVTLFSDGDAGSFEYYAAVLSGDEVIHVSDPAPPIGGTGPAGTGGTATGAGEDAAGSGEGTPPAGMGETAGGDGGTTDAEENADFASGGEGSTPTPPPPGGVVYYNPDGTISGTVASESPTANFWVQYVNKRMQVGWQNLPAESVSVVLKRSPTESGPFTSFATFTNIDPAGDAYQIASGASQEAHYYILDARGVGDAVIATYGPEFLDALEN